MNVDGSIYGPHAGEESLPLDSVDCMGKWTARQYPARYFNVCYSVVIPHATSMLARPIAHREARTLRYRVSTTVPRSPLL